MIFKNALPQILKITTAGTASIEKKATNTCAYTRLKAATKLDGTLRRTFVTITRHHVIGNNSLIGNWPFFKSRNDFATTNHAVAATFTRTPWRVSFSQ